MTFMQNDLNATTVMCPWTPSTLTALHLSVYRRTSLDTEHTPPQT